MISRCLVLVFTVQALCALTGCGAEDSSADHPGNDAGVDADAGSAGSGGTGGGAGDASCGSASDPENCGSCGHSCKGSSCILGRCEPAVLYEQPGLPYGVQRVALGGANIFWNDIHGQVWRGPRAGGTATLISTESNKAIGMAFSDGALFWADRYGNTVRVAQIPTDQVTTLASLPGGPFDVTARDGEPDLYVGTRDGGEVVRLPRAGGAPASLASDEVDLTGIASDASFVAWVVNRSPGFVRKLDKATGTVTTLASGQVFPRALAIAAGHVYWVCFAQSGPTVFRAALAGGAVEPLAELHQPKFVAADGQHVFITAADSVWRVPAGGGQAVVMATGQSSPEPIAVDDSWVYWGADQGRVMRLAK